MAVAAVVLAGTVGCSNATESEFNTFRVVGRVTSASGTPVPSAAVVVRLFRESCTSTMLSQQTSATTNAAGRYVATFSLSFEGCARVDVTPPGGSAFTATREGVRGGAATNDSIVLDVALP
jgi:hypothetical protein